MNAITRFRLNNKIKKIIINGKYSGIGDIDNVMWWVKINKNPKINYDEAYKIVKKILTEKNHEFTKKD